MVGLARWWPPTAMTATTATTGTFNAAHCDMLAFHPTLHDARAWLPGRCRLSSRAIAQLWSSAAAATEHQQLGSLPDSPVVAAPATANAVGEATQDAGGGQQPVIKHGEPVLVVLLRNFDSGASRLQLVLSCLAQPFAGTKQPAESVQDDAGQQPLDFCADPTVTMFWPAEPPIVGTTDDEIQTNESSRISTIPLIDDILAGAGCQAQVRTFGRIHPSECSAIECTVFVLPSLIPSLATLPLAQRDLLLNYARVFVRRLGIPLAPGCVLRPNVGQQLVDRGAAPANSIPELLLTPEVAIDFIRVDRMQSFGQSAASDSLTPMAAVFQFVSNATHVSVNISARVYDAGVTIHPQTSLPLPPEPMATGGLAAARRALREMILMPFRHRSAFMAVGVEAPKGILLHGVPGCGKTTLVQQVAAECEAHLSVIRGPELFGPYIGETEELLRAAFANAQRDAAAAGKPCIVFIDEIDVLCPKRGETSQHENRIVAQLLTLMDGMTSRGSTIVVGATNRPHSIDPALRRPGRFDREIRVDVPDQLERLGQLQQRCADLPLLLLPALDAVELETIAAMTNGFVGADIAHLVRETSLLAMQRLSLHDSLLEPSSDSSSSAARKEHASAVEALKLRQSDFVAALSHVVPSTQRGHKRQLLPTRWEDIGGMASVKTALQQCIAWPLLHAESFARMGLQPARGILLYGPPGCSKTTLVRAAANTSNITFLSKSGAEIYSPFVGESERSIRELFLLARRGAPSVIFLDEIDAMVGKRRDDGAAGGSRDVVAERVLSTLLNEMDGIDAAKNVVVVAATNRPDMLDAALIRPGRFDRAVYVGPPDEDARIAIFEVHATKKLPVDETVVLADLAAKSVGCTGADIEGICREAAFSALRRWQRTQSPSAASAAMPAHVPSIEQLCVTSADFEAAFAACRPSLSAAQLKEFELLHKEWGTGAKS